jgi:hypothetical protein
LNSPAFGQFLLSRFADYPERLIDAARSAPGAGAGDQPWLNYNLRQVATVAVLWYRQMGALGLLRLCWLWDAG